VASRCVLTFPFRQRRDGFSQLVVWREYPVIPEPVLPRRWDEVGEPVQELKRHELDDTIGSRPRGVSGATGPDPILASLAAFLGLAL
jgi:hypothetical protein